MPGSLEVICGPMFSGKTESLIKRITTAEDDGQQVAVFKPVTDTRHNYASVVGHAGSSVAARWLDVDARGLSDVIRRSPAQLIAIDEIQFFSPEAVPRILQAVHGGLRVIVAGLDLTYWGEPFGPVPMLMAYANVVTKLTSLCAKCGDLATRTYRTAADTTVLIGGAEAYEPRCLACLERG